MRIWEKETIEAGTPTKKKFLSYVIRCGAPGCEEMAVGGGKIGGFSAHDALPKVFGQKGWTVGSKPRHDRCPRCTRKHADGQRRLEEASMKSQPAATVTHIHAPAPPDTMSFQDRRVIFSKLEEVYINETVGYAAGWSDEKVSDDLGTPLAWVAAVREQNFGPNKSEHVTQILKDGNELLAAARVIADQVDTWERNLREALRDMAKISLRIDKFDKDLKDLAKRAGK